MRLDINGLWYNTSERIALMRRYLAVFDASSIELLLADLEFIGHGWFDFLNENNIVFAIRIKNGEWLIIASNREPKWALRQYKRGGRSNACLAMAKEKPTPKMIRVV